MLARGDDGDHDDLIHPCPQLLPPRPAHRAPQILRAEILEDLRKGAFRVQVRDTTSVEAADRLGARVFSGFVVAGLFVAAAILGAAHELWQAGVVAGLGVLYGGAHRFAVFRSEFRRKKD